MAGFSLDRVCRDSKFSARFPDASFDNDIGIEAPADFANIDRHSLELECRRSRDHLQSCDVRERVYDFFADSVAKIVLLRLRAHVHERQYGNGRTYLDCSADFLVWLLGLCAQPAKNGYVTAGPPADQDRVISPRIFVILLQLRSKAASLNPDNGVDVRIVFGRAVEHLHCDRELFKTV